MDLISVIMPFYKKREYFLSSFKSVLSQSYTNIEIIIVYDDNNHDELNWVNSIVSNDKRTIIIDNKKNIGVSRSRNLAISKSNGKYLAFLDCDDIWLEHKLEKQLNFMKKNNLSISHTSYEIINNKNELIGKHQVKDILKYSDLINSCDIGLSTVMAKKEIFEYSKFKPLTTKEDYALWLELSRKGVTFKGLDICLTLWRKSPNSLSSHMLPKFVNAYKVYRNHEKYDLFKSFFLVINLSLHYLKKILKKKKL